MKFRSRLDFRLSNSIENLKRRIFIFVLNTTKSWNMIQRSKCQYAWFWLRDDVRALFNSNSWKPAHSFFFRQAAQGNWCVYGLLRKSEWALYMKQKHIYPNRFLPCISLWLSRQGMSLKGMKTNDLSSESTSVNIEYFFPTKN